jgi:hypothetical protein
MPLAMAGRTDGTIRAPTDVPGSICAARPGRGPKLQFLESTLKPVTGASGQLVLTVRLAPVSDWPTFRKDREYF